jgi:hypothetical protein
VEDIELLQEAGADGWELVAITSNNVAFLKRPLPAPARAARRKTTDDKET